MPTVGIDFGTRHCRAAVAGRLLPSEKDAERLFPVYIASLSSGVVVFGAHAQRRYRLEPYSVPSSLRRFLGVGWGTPEMERYSELYPFQLAEGENATVGIHTARGALSVNELAAEMMTHVTQVCDIDGTLVDVSLTVPHSFDITRRVALEDVASRAGIRRLDLLAEGEAVARAYRGHGLPAGPVAVYDLGAGKFECSIVSIAEAGITTLASAGDATLCGDDLDLAFALRVAEQLADHRGYECRESKEDFARLVMVVSGLKERLCDVEACALDLSAVDPAIGSELNDFVVTQKHLSQIAGPMLAKTYALCDVALERAGLAPSDLTAVLLSGGLTNLPNVRDEMADRWHVPVLSEVDPLRAVVLGASIT